MVFLSNKYDKFIINFLIYMTIIIIFSVLTVFKYGPIGLNGDILILQSISFDNVTLFYWGQNRIINIIPFMVQQIKNPILNLFFILFIPSISCFLLIYFISLLTTKFYKNNNFNVIGIIFLINIITFILFFKNKSWVDVFIHHFEYSISLLFFVINIYFIFTIKSVYKYLSYLLGVICIGINYSTFLVSVGFSLFIILYDIKMYKKGLLFLFIYSFYFILWILVGKCYGGIGYFSSIQPLNFFYGFDRMLQHLADNYIYWSNLFLFSFIIFCIIILCNKYCGDNFILLDIKSKKLINYSLFYIYITTILVCCINWVSSNDFYPRYNIPNLFVITFIESVFIFNILKIFKFNKKLINSFLILFILITSYFLYPKTFNLKESEILIECNNIISPSSRFYVGNYWKIWPLVTRDLIEGYKSYALGYRSDSNKNNIIDKIKCNIKKNNKVELHCIQENSEACINQFKVYFNHFTIEKIDKINDNNTKITLGSFK